MKRLLASAVLTVTVMGLTAPVLAARPLEDNARNAFRMILSGADTNKDGKLSVNECMGIYKDKTMASRNCAFWDVNKDGFITEDEYVKRGMGLGGE